MGSIPTSGTFLIKIFMLYIAAFISGAGVMVLELVGSRIVAPYIGTSTFVWTSIIGIVLAGLSGGYYYGGKLADREANLKTLSRILFISGILIFISTLLESFVGPIFSREFGLRSAAILVSIVLFGPASFCLGIVSPYIARLKLTDMATSGKTVGMLYALSTVGSIVGTFLGGFYLISYFGSMNILFGLSALFIALSIAVSFSRGSDVKMVNKIFPFLIFLFLISNLPVETRLVRAVTDFDTNYGRFWIYETRDAATGKPTRLITNSIHGIQSGMFIEEPQALLFDYTKYFTLSEYFNPNFKSALLIGAGGYSYPKYFLHTYPDKTIDVVEIDEELTDVARKYFELKDDPQLSIINEDGRIFINNNKKKYDVVFLDAFLSSITVPFHLSTVEFLEKVKTSLNEDGIVVANVISATEGENSKFLKAELATFKKVFPAVKVFKVKETPGNMYQNLIFIAGNVLGENPPKPIEAMANLLRTEISLPTDLLPPLTDAFAPVELYTDQTKR